MLPCQVPRKSISLSWLTGSPSGAIKLSSQEVNVSVMADGETQWCYHARFLGSQYLCRGGRGLPVVLPCQVLRKQISPSCQTGSISGATMLGSQDVNISVITNVAFQWCYHARFLGNQYLRHDGRGVPVVLRFYVREKSISRSCWTGTTSAATMLGSQEVNVYAMADEGSQWYYHARLLGNQYLCHGGREALVVLPCQVARKSMSLSWWTGSPIGTTLLGSQEVNISVMVDEESQWGYHVRFIGSQYIGYVGLGVPVVLPCQVPSQSISLSCQVTKTILCISINYFILMRTFAIDIIVLT